MSASLTYQETGAVSRDETHIVFAQTMGYVAATAAFFAAGAYLGRDLAYVAGMSIHRRVRRPDRHAVRGPQVPAAGRGAAWPGSGELPALLQVARRALAAGVPVGVLLDGQVPDVPSVAAVVPQHRFLGGAGVQPEPGHANTLSDTTDISGEVTRRFRPGLEAGVSTPRS